MTERQPEQDDEQRQEPVVVRDRRKIDPLTGELRQSEDVAEGEPAEPAESAEVPAVEFPDVPETPLADTSGPSAGEGIVDEAVIPPSSVAEVEKQLEERTADLQRVQAEYANYRRRVDREREAMASGGKASVVTDLLPLLDDLERAQAHGDLTGAFKAVADKLTGVLEKAGLESFGDTGEPFDPSVHEAVQHDTSPEVDGPTVTTVLRRGYRFGDRVLRAALVAVTDHEPSAEAPAEGQRQPVDPPVNGELPIDADENAR
ncbi:nucleotide exchange factor GrpE [Saccharomonospora piscinae]|uniref:nucleotide exchange factor GrpE n=1 Tax=Saccharomonospora piscinae TaxID=687388 RepID=UPI0004633E10|nr:nucleotide exchange factor GrpE [Saccharomonospora piscinae]